MENYRTLKTIDGYQIAAAHTVVDKKILILWLHGITVNKDEYLEFFKEGAEYVSQKGIDSLRIDFRGHGDSSGTSLDFSIIGQMMDVDSAIQYIFQSYPPNTIKLHVVGCSFGAPPAIYAAANYSQYVRSLILISPVLSYWRTFLDPETEWGKSIFNKKSMFKLNRTKQLYIEDTFPISIRLIEEMKLLRPDLTLAELQQNTVIIHGDADSMVPYRVSKDISGKISAIKFISMPGMDHGFMDASDELGTSYKSLQNKKYIYDVIAEQCL